MRRRPLSDRQKEVLGEVPAHWVRPMDIGGRDSNDVSRVLQSLVARGLVQARRRHTIANILRSSSRGSYEYRLKPAQPDKENEG